MNRTRTGLVAAGLVATAAWLRMVVLPRRPEAAPTPQGRVIPHGDPRPLPDGDGVCIVVNPAAGGAWRANPADELRERLPRARVVELGDGDDLRDVLSDDGCPVVGAAGGDGTLAAAATVAVERDALFAPIPAGTLNHFGRDLGLRSLDDAIEAVRSGYEARIDVGAVGTRIFLNTFSFGGYTAVVDTRERWQPRLGKWPALVVALARELPRMAPLRMRIDGVEARVWIGWVGNGAYSPAGLAPAWRETLDDGLLDVRLVYGDVPLARTRFAVAALTGRLRFSRVYRETRVPSLRVEFLDGPQRLAADGETFDGEQTFEVTKRRKALRVSVRACDETSR